MFDNYSIQDLADRIGLSYNQAWYLIYRKQQLPTPDKTVGRREYYSKSLFNRIVSEFDARTK